MHKATWLRVEYIRVLWWRSWWNCLIIGKQVLNHSSVPWLRTYPLRHSSACKVQSQSDLAVHGITNSRIKAFWCGTKVWSVGSISSVAQRTCKPNIMWPQRRRTRHNPLSPWSSAIIHTPKKSEHASSLENIFSNAIYASTDSMCQNTCEMNCEPTQHISESITLT